MHIPDLEAFNEAVSSARRPRTLEAGGISRAMVDVSGIPGALRLPCALVRLLENVVRRAPSDGAAQTAARRVVEAGLSGEAGEEVDFMPARVLFQDFTGVPVFCDFAAMRDAMVARGGDPARVNPKIPCVLVVDHSVCADEAGCPSAMADNLAIEASRNAERFAFLKWAGASFDNVTIVPPGQGICHQLNVERFCDVVGIDALWEGDGPMACFDTLVGTDSHTTTANGLGVMGWGVGGIEAEAAALGQPIPMLVPRVVELRMTGELASGVSAMDLALTVAELLRAEGVVGQVVEATGPGAVSLSVTQRACVANMSPEYGSTSVLFPMDERLFDYLRLTGRDPGEVAFAEAYVRAQGLLDPEVPRVYAKTLELDLSCVETSLAGPSRPHRRTTPAGLRARFEESAERNGHGDMSERFGVVTEDGTFELGHGALAIAAITSCTTATDAAMVVAAGLAAKRAVEAGLVPKPWVKKILAPGSRAAGLLLERAGLLAPLEQLGFYTCGYGCMSCIGNSGDILSCLKPWSVSMELTSVLSGNRNFDGRISPDVAQNYLASPALVVAYSLVGTMDVDLAQEPVGTRADGSALMLSDLLPGDEEVAEVLAQVLDGSLYDEGMAHLMEGDATWRFIEVEPTATFSWDPDSTYIRRPPYFEIARAEGRFCLEGARCLVDLGDFVTTDHISPAGAIAPASPAAAYLEGHGVACDQFNTYGSRRGNHEVMERGTFANVKLENRLAGGERGCVTRDLLTGELASVWDAAEDYRANGVPLLVLAGKMYGSGSSRDWAAKGPLLQGVRAVVAGSFERIHRSNLVGMGLVPLELVDGDVESIGLDGTELFSVDAIDFTGGLPEPAVVGVHGLQRGGKTVDFQCRVRVDTPTEGAYIAAGGILPYVLESLL
ncbi:aconitate hydratase AcnA [Atopobiaceae bacterium 24-176]